MLERFRDVILSSVCMEKFLSGESAQWDAILCVENTNNLSDTKEMSCEFFVQCVRKKKGK